MIEINYTLCFENITETLFGTPDTFGRMGFDIIPAMLEKFFTTWTPVICLVGFALILWFFLGRRR